MCEDVEECDKDPLTYMTKGIPTMLKDLMPIGLAKDGHMIMGPYRADGTLWQPCDVDECNGLMIGGNYVYVSTLFHPYTVACWGPSDQGIVAGVCSSNTKTCAQSFGILSQNSS